MMIQTNPSTLTINTPQTPPFSLAPLPPPLPALPLAPHWGGGIYCNRTTTMRILKKRIISTDRDTITRIFMREKAYRTNSNFSTENSNILMRRDFINTCILIKNMTWALKNVNSGTKNLTMKTRACDITPPR